MKEPCAGKPITGNFASERQFPDLSKITLKKEAGVLYASDGTLSVPLNPLDEEGSTVVDLFSSDALNCESIYKLAKTGDNISVVLFRYNGEPTKVVSKGDRMLFYVSGGNVDQFAQKLGVAPEAIVPKLEDEFLYKKSVFVIADLKHRSNKCTLVGPHFFADYRNEGNVVNEIINIRARAGKDFPLPFLFFGEIHFVDWKDTLQVHGKIAASLKSVSVPAIFETWREFLAFERNEFLDNRRKDGIVPFREAEVDYQEGTVTLGISKEWLNSPLLDTEDSRNEIDCCPCVLESLPNTVDDIDDTQPQSKLFLGPLRSVDFKNGKAIFKPRLTAGNAELLKDLDETQSGYLMLSDFSLENEETRREKILNVLAEKTNSTGNILMNLASDDIQDSQNASTFIPVDSNVLEAMFGPEGKDVKINDNYREALSIALNTPDFAIIQGPPGTGKTTLIKGLVAKLLSNKNRDYKILIATEQHEALDNTVGGVAKTRSSIPPFISSARYDIDEEEEDERKMSSTVISFRSRFIENCHQVLSEAKGEKRFSSSLLDAIYAIDSIKSASFDPETIKEILPNLKKALNEMGIEGQLSGQLSSVEYLISLSGKRQEEPEEDVELKIIKSKIAAQRTDLVSWKDDGPAQLAILQRVLGNSPEWSSMLIGKELAAELGSENPTQKAFDDYKEYVGSLKKKITPETPFDAASPKAVIENNINAIAAMVRNTAETRKKDLYDIVEELTYLLDNFDVSKNVVRSYTDIIGSTCAQSSKSAKYVSLVSGSYDYVIIDEAARANPIDIMIPIFMGKKVVLVGDHAQLPHYIESRMVSEFEKKGAHTKDSENLKTSLFQKLYTNLDAAWKAGRIKARRTIRLNEQHRMNPAIAEFISDEFYSSDKNIGGLVSAPETAKNVNSFKVFDEKNVVFLDVGDKFLEEPYKRSFRRRLEAEETVKILKDIFTRNPKDEKLSIGIISFYGAQVELLNDMIKADFAPQIRAHIKCDTVDSFQGNEFDIVILSCVRCNDYPSPRTKLGFLYDSPSRINVSLSRARKLLVVIGDGKTLSVSKEFKDYIEYSKKKGGYYGIGNGY